MKMTVVTICRNDLDGLERTYESLESQDYQEFEWWVVDGASSDGTVGWLQKNHDRAGGWISEADRGIYDAMNKGTARALGDFLVYMNSGDTFASPRAVSQLAHEIDRDGRQWDFLYGDAIDVLEDGRSHISHARPLSRVLLGMPARHQSMVFRRESLQQRPYDEDYPLSGDYALVASLSKQEGIATKQVDFAISRCMLGGIHTTRRLSALSEDYSIRRNILGASHVTCSILYLLHFAHHWFRSFLPSLNAKFVYR